MSNETAASNSIVGDAFVELESGVPASVAPAFIHSDPPSRLGGRRERTRADARRRTEIQMGPQALRGCVSRRRSFGLMPLGL